MDSFGSSSRNLTTAVAYMLVVFVLATTGYVLAGWSFGDALYMVVLTIYTVGYEEVRPINTPLLRDITIITIVLGCTGMIFLTGALVQFITITQLEQVFGPKRMQKQIDSLTNHVIICGFGRIGQMLAQELKAGGARFVVLERSEHRAAQARNLDYLCLEEDATDEAALKHAGVDRARTLATVLPDDAANVFITLSARSLNKTIEIIARGEAPTTEKKLLYAGANKVVLPTHIGAERIAEMILFQAIAPLTRGSDNMRNFERTLSSLGLQMQIVIAAQDDPFTGLSIDAIETQAKGSFLIVQLNHRNGETTTSPQRDTVIEAGDGIVTVGRGGVGLFSRRSI